MAVSSTQQHNVKSMDRCNQQHKGIKVLTVLFKVHPNDKPNNRGRLLLRMFLLSDYNQIYLSVLCSFQIRAVECLDQSERSAVPSDALRRHRDELPPTWTNSPIKVNRESLPIYTGFILLKLTLCVIFSKLASDRKSLANLIFCVLYIATSSKHRTNLLQETIWDTGFLKFRLGQCSESEPAAWFEILVAACVVIWWWAQYQISESIFVSKCIQNGDESH
jgi:hypothetical protein